MNANRRLGSELALVVSVEVLILLVRNFSFGRLVVTIAVVGAAIVSSEVLLAGRLRPRFENGRALIMIAAVLQIAVIMGVLTKVEWWLPLVPALLITLARAQRIRQPDSVFRKPRALTSVFAGAVFVGASPAFSLGTTLIKPSSDSFSIRTVEWLRMRGGDGIVNGVEHWWYSRHAPPKGGAPAIPISIASSRAVVAAVSVTPNATGLVPTPTSAVAKPTDVAPTPTGVVPRVGSVPTTQAPTSVSLPGAEAAPTLTPVRPLVSPVLPGEGQWEVIAGAARQPAIAVTRIRPDAIHTSVVVSVARMDTSLVRLRLVAGTEDPGGAFPEHGQVPAADRKKLLAVFNSGFRQREAAGGFWENGVATKPLVNGSASVVIRTNGSATVANWGRDATLGPDVAAVRQNLRLIVDNGASVAGLDDSTNRQWGRTVGHRVLVWRSGIGVAKDGALLYVGGPSISIRTLANVLVAAGAIRGMELDINSSWVSYYLYTQSAKGPVGTKLLPGMRHAPTRYLRPQSRDFFAVLAR